MADAGERTTGRAGDPSQSGTATIVALFRDNVFPLLIGIVSAAGFVAAIGGITMWSRFFVTELPPEQAVDAVADPELIVTGAVALVLFVVGGLLIVTFAYVIDAGGRQTVETARTLLVLAVLGGLVACVAAEENEFVKAGLAALVAIAAGALGLVVFNYLEDKDERKRLRPTEGETVGPWNPLWGEEPRRPPYRFVLKPGGRVALVALTLVCAAIMAVLLSKGTAQGAFVWGIAVLLAVALMWGCYAVAYSSGGRFVWYGLSLFLSVLLFGTYIGLADVLIHQRVQAVAVIRDNDRPGQGVLGFYVAETGDRLYLATVAIGCDETRIRKDSGRLFWVDRDDIRAMAIGPQQDPEHVEHAPDEMLRELWAAGIPLGNTVSDKQRPRTARVRNAADLDDESDSGDSQRAAEDLPEPPPAVSRAPKFHSMRVDGARNPGAPARPGDTVTLEGADFGINPAISVDDVRVTRIVSRPDPHGDSEVRFVIPARAESGRVEVRCGERRPQELLIAPRSLRVVVNVSRRSGGRLRLAARPPRDSGELRYRWRLPGGREKRQMTIFERMPDRRRLRIRLTITDDEGPRGATVVSVRVRDGRLDVDQRFN